MVQMIRPGCARMIAATLLSLLACTDASALRCNSDPSYPGSDGSGESDEWRVEYVDRTVRHYFQMRATNKVDGSTTTWRITTPFGGSVHEIQVYRSRAVIMSYITRGIYHVILHDLAEQREVAQFHAYDFGRSPDDRYLLYRIGYSAVGPWDPRVFLLDLLADAGDEALIAGRADCGLLFPCDVEVGIPVFEMPSWNHRVHGLVWDLLYERLMFTAPDSEDGRSLFVLSLAGRKPEIVCRVPIHGERVQGEFSAPLRSGVRGLSYESADDVAVIRVQDQNGIRSDYRVSLAGACAGQGAL